MGVPAFISAAPSIMSGLQSLTFLNNPRDRERFQKTDDAFRLAMQGDRNALLFLKQRTGSYGIVTVPGYGEIGGWATAAARNYAQAKYNEVIATANVNNALGQAAGLAQQTANEAGYSIVPGTPWQLIAVGVLALGAVWFIARRR